MINEVYLTLQTILNKENKGYVSPMDFNILAHQVQLEIFREYFEDENRDKNKENRGMTGNGYANLAFNVRQRIDEFAASAVLAFDTPTQSYPLPVDLYMLEDNGLTTNTGRVIEEVERQELGYLQASSTAASSTFPVYERFNKYIRVYPATITTAVSCRYLRKPAVPKWTYATLPGGTELFNPSASDYQDFELHPSEFSNIVLKMLTYFSVNLREGDVVQVAETLKDKANVKDNA